MKEIGLPVVVGGEKYVEATVGQVLCVAVRRGEARVACVWLSSQGELHIRNCDVGLFYILLYKVKIGTEIVILTASVGILDLVGVHHHITCHKDGQGVGCKQRFDLEY